MAIDITTEAAATSYVASLRSPTAQEHRSIYSDRPSAVAPESTRSDGAQPRSVGLTSDPPSADDLPRGVRPEAAARAIVRVGLAARYDEFLDERNGLVAQGLEGTLSDSGRRRLEFLRWQLDRIEDALGGDSLDRLELMVQQHEALGERIEAFLAKLTAASATALTPRHKKK